MIALTERARVRRAHALLRKYRAPYVLEAKRALLGHLLHNPVGTADDVRNYVVLPEDIDPRCIGAALRDLSAAGVTRSLGKVPSKRPVANGRKVTVWELVSTAIAWDWLHRHPSMFPPVTQPRGVV